MAITTSIDVALRGDTSSLDKSLAKSTDSIRQFAAQSQAGGNAVEKTFAFGGIGRGLSTAFAGIGKAFAGIGKTAETAVAAILKPFAGLGGKIGGVISGVAGSVGVQVGGIGSSFSGLAAVAGIAAAAVVAGIAAIGAAAVAAVSHLSQLGKTAAMIGVTVEGLSKLQGAAQLSGISVETFTHGLQHFEKVLGEASQGGGEMIALFARLGLQVKELSDMPVTDAVIKLAESLALAGNQADKMNFVSKIFGREGGAEFLRLLNRGAEGIAKLKEQAMATGVAVNAADIASIRAATLAWGQLKAAITGIGNTLAIAFGPLLQSAAETISRWGISFATAFREVRAEIQAVVTSIANIATNIVAIPFNLLVDGISAASAALLGYEIDWKKTQRSILETFFIVEFASSHLGDALIGVFATIWRYLVKWSLDVAHLLTDGIGKLLEGASWEDAMKRPLTKYEKELEEALDWLAGDFGREWDKFFEDKMKALENAKAKAPPEALPKANPLGAVASGNKAAVEGGLEAFHIIAGAQQDKMWAVANDQLKANKDAVKQLQKLVDVFKNGVKLAKAKFR